MMFLSEINCRLHSSCVKFPDLHTFISVYFQYECIWQIKKVCEPAREGYLENHLLEQVNYGGVYRNI